MNRRNVLKTVAGISIAALAGADAMAAEASPLIDPQVYLAYQITGTLAQIKQAANKVNQVINMPTGSGETPTFTIAAWPPNTYIEKGRILVPNDGMLPTIIQHLTAINGVTIQQG